MTLEDRIARLEALVERQAKIIVEKDAQIARLSRRIEDLERRFGERDGGAGPPKGGEGKPREPSGRKPGGQPGHKGHQRKMVSADKVTRTEECCPRMCRGCGRMLAQTADASPVLHQVVKIPAISPDVTEFRLHRVKWACGMTTCGSLPVGTPRGMMGPRLVAFIALLSANWHVSRRKVKQLLNDHPGHGHRARHALGVGGARHGSGRGASTRNSAARAGGAGEARRRHYLVPPHAFRSLWVLATKGVTVFTTFEAGTKVALSRWQELARAVVALSS